MATSELVGNQQELLAAMQLEDPADLADSLWAYVDGVVNFSDRGIDLQPGIQHEELAYPFTVRDLWTLARRLEESEVLLQAAAGGPRAQPSKARLAKSAHDAFADEAQRLAQSVLGPGFKSFAPRAMTSFAWWYEDRVAAKLLAVVAPTELPTVTDEVLAYALAWQQDRELILVLSEAHCAEVTRRLPWVASPITVRTMAGIEVLTSEHEVLAATSALPKRTVRPFSLSPLHAAWVERLLAEPDVAKLPAHPRANYVSWHNQGLQVLRLTPARGGLRIDAGVQYSRPQPGHTTFNMVLTAPLTDAELSLAVAAVRASAAGQSLTNDQTEHRLQASMGASPPAAMGLPFLAREYPAYRGPGRPGFIDFLGCDVGGQLHVVETKIGHDPKVVLQALDYGIWVRANDQDIRNELPDWPIPPQEQSQIYLDFVLASGAQASAVGPYLASQLEVLRADVTWRIFVVENADEVPVSLSQVPPEAIWRAQKGVTSQPVRPQRSAGLA